MKYMKQPLDDMYWSKLAWTNKNRQSRLSQMNNMRGIYLFQTLHKSDSFASICTGMWCAVNNNTNNCTLTIPADGTTCGDKKVGLEDLITPFMDLFSLQEQTLIMAAG